MAPTMEYTYWVLTHRTAEGEWEELPVIYATLAEVKEAWNLPTGFRNLTILEVTVTKRTIVP